LERFEITALAELDALEHGAELAVVEFLFSLPQVLADGDEVFHRTSAAARDALNELLGEAAVGGMDTFLRSPPEVLSAAGAITCRSTFSEFASAMMSLMLPIPACELRPKPCELRA